MTRSKSLTVDGVQRMYFGVVPIALHECPSCGREPRHVWDANNHFVIGWDETRRIDAEGRMCIECCEERAKFDRGFTWEWRP